MSSRAERRREKRAWHKKHTGGDPTARDWMVPSVHPALSTECVAYVSPEAAHGDARRLCQTLRAHANGVGLAAPQIGITRQLIAIWPDRSMGGHMSTSRPKVMVNPKIVAQSNEMVESVEGCLSYPGRDVKIARFKWVRVHWLDLDGQHHEEKFERFAGFVVQHELDHLRGVCKVKLYWDTPDPALSKIPPPPPPESSPTLTPRSRYGSAALFALAVMGLGYSNRR